MNRLAVQRVTTTVAAIVMVVAIAACAGDPTPLPATPTPAPTATLTPAPAATPTPAPTATPTPAPTATTQVLPTATEAPPTEPPAPTVAPTQPASPPTTVPLPPRVAISIDELEITDETTLSHVIAALSDDEVLCIRDFIGLGAFDVALSIPLSALPADIGEIPVECLSEENAIGLGVAYLSRDAGGLDAETRSCVRNIVTQTPAVLDVGDPPDNPIEIAVGLFGIQLCLTDEEAATLALGGENELPPPSALRCLAEQMGGVDALVEALSQGEADPSTILGLMVAAQACEP